MIKGGWGDFKAVYYHSINLPPASYQLNSGCTFVWAVHIIMCMRDEWLISQHYLWGRGCYFAEATILDTVQTYLQSRDLTFFYYYIIN